MSSKASAMGANETLHNKAVESILNQRSDSTAHLAPLQTSFGKANQRVFERRESLLTRQIQSENELTDEELIEDRPRALSTQSTYSMASTAELTSDDGQSVPSPTLSPPLPPAMISSDLTSITKLPLPEPKIVANDDRAVHKPLEPISEKSLEANLGRKRCISFACGGGKGPQPPTSHPRVPPPQPQAAETSTSPPKRKCSLKFVCPTRSSSTMKATDRPSTPVRRVTSPPARRVMSPPPPARRNNSSIRSPTKVHRDSDSTLRHASPKASRKSPSIVTTAATPTPPRTNRKFSDDVGESGEATRFHVFGSSEDEQEDWCQESTAYRSRLTMSEVLKKENLLRKACEEVEEEAVEEDEDEEAQLDDDEAADEDDVEDDEDDLGLGDEDDSDDGFDTDDEGGFAEDSDSDGEDSDADWWTPGGLSTAATSVEHMERLFSQIPAADLIDASSVGSGASSDVAPDQPRQSRRKRDLNSVAIPRDPDASDLPDSTDFVCGTLDEDRPVEQAFLESMKQREAAKRITRPQDIDPSFPTSDPEMDEEDDEDLIESKESPDEFMHGRLEELESDVAQPRRASPRPRAKNAQRSRSPAPTKLTARARSPAPLARALPTRKNTRSPPPPISRARSPAPTKIRITGRSPPPPIRRSIARSPPPPKKAMGHSPKRARSPAPVSMLSSAVGTAVGSPTSRTSSISFAMPGAFGSLVPTLSQVASSLPRGGEFVLSRLNSFNISEDDEPETPSAETESAANKDLPKRGAIDIVKGLEKKRQRRREKMLQKAAAKAATKGEKAYKVKPGKGAERMREVGLELQRYRGKGEHIISM